MGLKYCKKKMAVSVNVGVGVGGRGDKCEWKGLWLMDFLGCGPKVLSAHQPC